MAVTHPWDCALLVLKIYFWWSEYSLRKKHLNIACQAICKSYPSWKMSGTKWQSSENVEEDIPWFGWQSSLHYLTLAVICLFIMCFLLMKTGLIIGNVTFFWINKFPTYSTFLKLNLCSKKILTIWWCCHVVINLATWSVYHSSVWLSWFGIGQQWWIETGLLYCRIINARSQDLQKPIVLSIEALSLIFLFTGIVLY